MVFLVGILIPVAKNIVTMIIWFLPSSLVNTSRRLVYLNVLCNMGKVELSGKHSVDFG